MNMGEIAELFIRAAEIDRAMPERVGPQPPRSVALPYVHSWVDKLGWGSDKLAEERKLFWERLGLLPSSHELDEIEILRAWLLVLEDESERRALLAWARAKAGGRSFKRWCLRIEGIHPQTGRRRKDRALARISAHLAREGSQKRTTAGFDLLPVSPEIDHSLGTLEEDAVEHVRDFSWRSDPSLKPTLVPDMQSFSWAEKRNAHRRQKRKQREKEVAKAGQPANPSSPSGPSAARPRK